MNWITVISIFITATATCFIAYYSYISTRLAHELKNQDKKYQDRFEHLTKQHQSDLSDLYQAIVIATLIGGSSNTNVVDNLVKTFNQHYQGKIEIFKKKE